jgi:hypothetical protein
LSHSTFVRKIFIHYFLSVEGRKEKSLFISGSFFFFPDFEIEVLHREVDGGFAEMKVCRVALRNCFLHSFLSDMFLMTMSSDYSCAIQSINSQTIIPIYRRPGQSIMQLHKFPNEFFEVARSNLKFS